MAKNLFFWGHFYKHPVALLVIVAFPYYMHCIVWYLMLFYCIQFHCTVLYAIALLALARGLCLARRLHQMFWQCHYAWVLNTVFSQCSETTGWETKKISGTNVKCKFTFKYTEAGVVSSSVWSSSSLSSLSSLSSSSSPSKSSSSSSSSSS